jgi:DNA repair exonuclease SbcCD ATPase subunit
MHKNTAQAMNAEPDYFQRSQERITELQQQVAERERAIQNKAKELLAREQLLNEQQELLEKREQIFDARQHSQRLANRNRASLIAPLLLITCVAAGYFAYEQIDQQRQYFQQVKAAEAHVDKLTRVLSITQERMVSNTSTIAERNTQLAQTQAKLEALENELAQLQDQESEVSQPPSLLDQLLLEKDAQGASLEIPQVPPSDLR